MISYAVVMGNGRIRC